MSDPVDLAAVRPRQAEGLSDDTLEELNRLWTIVRAFSTTAHDVNNALQVIAGSAELLEARELDAAVRRRVEIVRHESGKAAATIDRLLDYVRAPRQPVAAIDLWPLLDAAITMRQASLGRSRIVAAVNREGAQPAFVDGERGRLLQALLNLLLVAEARVAGRGKARIEIGVESGGSGVTVRVVTSAEGAPTAVPTEVSDGAHRPDALAKESELWAASYLAARHGGVMTADGDTFAISWPARS